MIKLFPNQLKAKQDIWQEFAKGNKKIIFVAPCGFGKTPTAVSIMNDAEQKGKTVLFIVHMDELMNQCSEHLSSLGVKHGVIKNKHPKVNPNAKIQLSSWQTLNRKIKNPNFKFVPDLIIFDEGQRSVAPRPMEVLLYFDKRALELSRPIYLICMTGTPYRESGYGLGSYYQKIVTTCSALDLINEGRLIKPKYLKINTELSNSDPDSLIVLEDGTEKPISEVSPDIIIGADIIRNFKKVCEKKQAVIFCPTVEIAESVCERFKKAGITANVIECHTKNRDALLRDFANKKFQVIVNAALLAEGWDYKELDCVILLRKIGSRALYRQACNRCMRSHPNKKEAFILDFFDNYLEHGMPWSNEIYTLEGKIQEEKIKKEKEESKDLDDKTDDVETLCSNCGTLCELKHDNCPECGEKLIKKIKKIIGEMKNDLVEFDESKENIPTMEDKQVEYNKLAAICMKQGYNPGWVSNQYRKKFGVWPNRMKKTEEFIKYSSNWENDKQSGKLIAQQLEWRTLR